MNWKDPPVRCEDHLNQKVNPPEFWTMFNFGWHKICKLGHMTFFLVAIDVPDKYKAGGRLIDYLGIFATSSPRDEVGISAVHTKPIKDNVKVRFIWSTSLIQCTKIMKLRPWVWSLQQKHCGDRIISVVWNVSSLQEISKATEHVQKAENDL